ncbi:MULTISPECIES: hybrid sensor histidine kinase/response regulator [Methylobacteriaceae]|uniref:hybrid sensor histidine kinase/response regulator n=1 Tax=Methylobacteriaceae TaxID=119045 RepID=UPI000D828DB3|nr:hybrid sensor histidine kinase/response regulator [Methylobacterium sp. B4]PXW53080.1 response regulator receiver domain-containing protein [Methylobacterium sp. B4]
MSDALPDGAEATLHILLLEDSDLDAELLAVVLDGIGRPYRLDRVMTREAFMAGMSGCHHDLILADYVLPTFDGLSALAIARTHCPAVPFVFVSGTLGEDVAVEALKNGATDYVTKQRLDRLPRVIVRALGEARAHAERRAAEQALRALNETLEARVAERTRELAEANVALQSQISERERVEEALRQAQRLEAVGQLTSGVAHDFNNLLTVIAGNIEFLERSVSDERNRRRLDMMRGAAERGARLTAQLLAFSRRQRLDPVPVRLNETVASMRDLLQSSIGGGVRIEMTLQPDLWSALVDATQIELIILNLAINARDAMAVGGCLTIETANVRLTAEPAHPHEPVPGEYAMVAVSDTGTGIAPEVIARVFEPFFTTKEIGKGSGLGLAQVYGFAKQSGGGVRIDTRLGEGTTVRVYLPRVAAASPADAAEPVAIDCASARAPGDRPVLLVVDDDSAVREITVTKLAEGDYVVREAGSGLAALNILEHDPCFDLVVMDFAMPGMNGVEVAAEIRRRWPAIPVLFVTGYADQSALTREGVGQDRIVQKPFLDGELERKAAAVLAARPAPNLKLVSSR